MMLPVLGLIVVGLFLSNLVFSPSLTPATFPLKPRFFPNDGYVSGTNGVVEPRKGLHFERTVVPAENHTDVFITLPPFTWSLPGGLTPEMERLFWAQPENMRHFNDTVMPVLGKVQIFRNARLIDKYGTSENDSHYMNYEMPNITATDSPVYETVMYLSGHETRYFQHFLDNGIPHVSLMQFAVDIDPQNITFCIQRCDQEVVKALLSRYGFKQVVVSSSPEEVSAKTLILAQIVPRLHPLFTRHFIDRMRFSYSALDRIVFVSRNSNTHNGNSARIIINEDDLVEELKKVYGSQFVVFDPATTPYEEAFDIFARARAVIGSHGGGLYNTLWASRKAPLIEIMPVQADGVYPEQGGANGFPSYCHLAFHTIATMNGHPYFRYYQMNDGLNYDVQIPEFVAWLQTVLPVH